MKSFLQYFSGGMAGVGLGILGMYYMAVSGKYVTTSPLLTTLVTVIGLNFLALGIIVGIWCYRRHR